jgi:hypothetical protein
LKRDLPEKRIGGTITQPHFADAELDMLFTSLPAKTTNALEYIAFQVIASKLLRMSLHVTPCTSQERYTRHVAACSATYEASGERYLQGFEPAIARGEVLIQRRVTDFQLLRVQPYQERPGLWGTELTTCF